MEICVCMHKWCVCLYVWFELHFQQFLSNITKLKTVGGGYNNKRNVYVFHNVLDLKDEKIDINLEYYFSK